MAKKRNIKVNKAEVLLGKNIERTRLRKKITRKQVGFEINKPEQQIAKYEAGAFIPLSVLEEIALALDEQIPKRLIRRISFARKLELEERIPQDDELIALYNEAFPDEDDQEPED